MAALECIHHLRNVMTTLKRDRHNLLKGLSKKHHFLDISGIAFYLKSPLVHLSSATKFKVIAEI
jgi:hypothetical protein